MASKTVNQSAKLASQAKLFNGIPTTPRYEFEFPFERSFKHQDARAWMTEHWSDSFYWSIGYVLVIFTIKFLMRNREPFKMRKLLFLWNLGLATFSIMGSIRFLPEVFYVLKNFGFDYSVCKSSYVEDSGVSGYWTFMFALSKVPELGDTLFIVLRKQPLIFLHWYHHITVLIFTWYSYWQHIAPARWYIALNYAVHSMMYTYYAVRAIGFRPPKPLAMFITLSQISQMIMGLYVTYYSYVNLSSCRMMKDVSLWGLAMYFSYFLLFAQFFVNAYFGRRGKPSSGKHANGSSSTKKVKKVD